MTTPLIQWENLGDRESRVRPDDFVRLGIGDREARVNVIRRATMAATAKFTSDTSTQSDSNSDEKIAEIAISAYRLLDPRGRNQLGERVQLIRPESTFTKVSPWWRDRNTSPARIDLPVDHFDTNAADENYVPTSLTAEDHWADIAASFGLPGLSLRFACVIVACSAALVLLMLLAVTSNGTAEPSPPEIAQTEAVETSHPEPDLPAFSLEPSVDVEEPGLKPTENDVAAASEGVSLAETSPEPADLSSEPFEMSSGLDGVVLNDALTGPSMFEAVDPQVVEIGTDITILEESDLDRDPETDASSPKGASEQPKIAEASEDALDETDPLIPNAEEMELLDEGRFPVPGFKDIELAKEQMNRMLADHPVPVADAEWIVSIQRLIDTANGSDEGSPDRWVLLNETATQLVLLNRFDDANNVCDELSIEFAIESTEVRLGALENVFDSADSITRKERAIEWAMILSDDAMRIEDFESASVAAKVATMLAIKVGDKELRTRISTHNDAIKAAKRMAPAAIKNIASSTPETADSSQATSVGRYLCLYIRDWEQGLPWLQHSSNLKLAKIARQELQPDSLDSVSQIALAWLELSDDVRGYPSISMLLHAQDLVAGALTTATGLKAEDLKKVFDDIQSALPEYLKDSESDEPNVAIVPGNDSFSGMLGRLQADGRDIGALIRYQPGLGITEQAVSQILSQLNVQTDIIMADFVGFVDLAEPTTVRFSTGGIREKAGSINLMIGNQKVGLVRDQQNRMFNAMVDLPEGRHLVHWQFMAQEIRSCHLSIENDRTKKPITASHSPALLDQVTLPTQTRLRVSIMGLGN